MSEDEKALLYNLRSLARMEHADLSIGDEAADAIERIARERDEARASESRMIREIDAVYAAVSNHWFLDPPDGGDVRLHEGVARIEQALTEAREEIERMRGALKPFARLAGNYDPPEGDDDHTTGDQTALPTLGDLRRARATLTPATPPAQKDAAP
jgi:hypothetical protein